jgi:phospholipid transport system substrate-binding protein
MLWIVAAGLGLTATIGATLPAPAADPASAPGAAVDSASPYDLIKGVADTLLQNLQAHRDEYRRDHTKLRMLIDQVVLPHFDSQFAAREVLGRSWLSATPQQRQRFVNAFYNSMLNNYGDALLDFTSDSMQVLPSRGPASGQYAVVNSRIRRTNGTNVAVNYQLHQTPAGWQVWDVVVEGISYDKSFQQDFSEQIQRQGLDAVISRLESGATPAAIKQTTGS